MQSPETPPSFTYLAKPDSSRRYQGLLFSPPVDGDSQQLDEPNECFSPVRHEDNFSDELLVKDRLNKGWISKN